MPSKPPWPDELPAGWRRQAEGLMAGVDEAGRGPLAGPVVAAAVMLDVRRPIAGVADSKLLAPAVRERLHDEILVRALCVSVAEASVEEIDRLNILRATLLAMRRAVEGLRLRPLRVLVDGNQLPTLALPMNAIVGGDARVRAISAASIVAKVHRDRLCLALHERHPQYGFDRHKGYPSPAHLAALREHGACEVHRRSYAPVREALAAGAATVRLQGRFQLRAEGRGVAAEGEPDGEAEMGCGVGPAPAPVSAAASESASARTPAASFVRTPAPAPVLSPASASPSASAAASGSAPAAAATSTPTSAPAPAAARGLAAVAPPSAGHGAGQPA